LTQLMLFNQKTSRSILHPTACFGNRVPLSSQRRNVAMAFILNLCLL